MEILDRYDAWRRVRMPDGSIGWVHHAMLSATRTVVVIGARKAVIRSGPAPQAKTLALAEPGVIAKLEKCRATACAVRVDGTEGWIDKHNIWGANLGERAK